MASAVASLNEKLQSVNEALEEYRSVASSCVRLLASENLLIQGHSISDHTRNMAAAFARSIVGEFLQGLPTSDHKQNIAAALTNLIGNFQTENEALEGLAISDLKRDMAAPVANLTENLKSLNEALEKAKNHLLQRVQNLDGKIDELREASKLNEGTKRTMAGAGGNLTDNLQCVNEAPEGLLIAEHKMAAELACFSEHKRKRACVNEVIEEEEDEMSMFEPIQEAKKAKKPKAKKSLSQVRRELEEAMGVLDEKQEEDEDEMTMFEPIQEAKKRKAKKFVSQRF